MVYFGGVKKENDIFIDKKLKIKTIFSCLVLIQISCLCLVVRFELGVGSQLSPAIILMSGVAHDGGILQSRLFFLFIIKRNI